MKRIYISFLILIPSSVLAQEVQQIPFILKHAYFAIAGETNVNDFSCRLTRQDLSDTLLISGNWEGLSLDIDGLSFDLATRQFDCGMKLMTRDFQKFLKSEVFPFVKLDIDKLHLTDDFNLDSLENVGSETTIQITDQSRREYIEYGYFRKYENQYILGGSHKIKMTNYNLEPPKKFLGTVKAKDELYIEFEVIFERLRPNQ